MTQRNRSRRCPVCSLCHRSGFPACTVFAPCWPVEALAAAVGGLDVLAARVGDGVRRAGMLSDAMADRWAVACGLHPELVWPGWCDAGLTVGDRQAIESGGWRPAWEWAEAQRSTATRGTAA